MLIQETLSKTFGTKPSLSPSGLKACGPGISIR